MLDEKRCLASDTIGDKDLAVVTVLAEDLSVAPGFIYVLTRLI